MNPFWMMFSQRGWNKPPTSGAFWCEIFAPLPEDDDPTWPPNAVLRNPFLRPRKMPLPNGDGGPNAPQKKLHGIIYPSWKIKPSKTRVHNFFLAFCDFQTFTMFSCWWNMGEKIQNLMVLVPNQKWSPKIETFNRRDFRKKLPGSFGTPAMYPWVRTPGWWWRDPYKRDPYL